MSSGSQPCPTERSALLKHPITVESACYPHGLQLYFIAFSLGSLLVISGIEVTIIATISAVIAEDFNNTKLAPYLPTSFLLASAVTGPIYARISDRLGRTSVILFAGLLLASGVTMCTVAPNMPLLLVARTVCGFGGGGLNILCQIILSESVQPKARAFWYSIGKLISALSIAIGGPLGGIIADKISWRLAFGIQIPVCIVALCSSFASLHRIRQTLPRGEESSRSASSMTSVLLDFDLQGSALLAVAITPLLLLFSLPSQDGLISGTTTTLLLLLVSVVGGLLLYRTETRAKQPIIDFDLLSNRTIALLCALNFTSSFTHNAIMYAIPWFTIIIDHATSTRAGTRLLPISVAASLGSLVVGAHVAKGNQYYAYLIISVICIAVAPWVLLFDTMGYKSTLLHEALQVLGVLPSAWGYQITSSISMVALLSITRTEDLAAITSLAIVAKSLGAVFGSVACTLASQIYLQVVLPSRIPFDNNQREIINLVRNSPQLIYTLSEELQAVAYDCWRRSFTFSLLFITIFSGMPVLVIIGARNLRTAMQEGPYSG